MSAATRAPREWPILFTGPMVRAILAGRKTQTRRPVDMGGIGYIGGAGQQDDLESWGYFMDDGYGRWAVLARDKAEHFPNGQVSIPCPYGLPGDRLWVRETWGLHLYGDFTCWNRDSIRGRAADDVLGSWQVVYQADATSPYDHWRPSIHMPRWASRLALEVTSVRVERLQSISERDASREGFAQERGATGQTVRPGAREAFQAMWSEIYGSSSWDENPWVWTIDFQRAQP